MVDLLVGIYRPSSVEAVLLPLVKQRVVVQNLDASGRGIVR